MNGAVSALSPARAFDAKRTGSVLVLFGAAAALLGATSRFGSLPSLGEIWAALGELWWTGGMGPELLQTMKLIAHATLITAALSLFLAYLSVARMFSPLVEALCKLRFLSLTALVFPLTLMTGGGYALKVSMLTFGMATFYLTAMARIVREIPRSRFEQLRVLGASDLRITWEIVVLGTLDKAVDGLRQNVAMGWSMITMVEGVSRSDGGIGAMMLNQHKHMRLAHVYAILLVVLGTGIAIDYAMGVLGGVLCPWSRRDAQPSSED